MTVAEHSQINCSGVITVVVDGKDVQGWVTLPCRMRLDTGGQDIGYQLPYKYQIYRERARMDTCCYWRNMEEDDSDMTVHPYTINKDLPELPEIFEFQDMELPDGVTLPKIPIIDPITNETKEVDDPDTRVVGGWAHELSPSFVVTPRTFKVIQIGGGPIPTKCMNDRATKWNQGLDDSPPCNGAKSECPYFTGRPYTWISDTKMAAGLKITGESLQEVRSLRIKDPIAEGDAEKAQREWENTYEVPYPWARDDTDDGVKYTDPATFGLDEASVYIMLTQIYWDVKKRKPSESIYPSSPEGQEKSLADGTLTPSFPTIIRQLGQELVPLVEITFPVRDVLNGVELDYFTYRQFDKGIDKAVNTPSKIFSPNKIYMAGLALAVSNIYVINKTLIPSCPDLNNLDINDERVKDQLSGFLKFQFIKSETYGNVDGFKITKSGRSRFWEILEGIELKENCYNPIYVVTEINNQYHFAYVNVRYLYYHVDVRQIKGEEDLQSPRTRDLVTRLSKTFSVSATGSPLIFHMEDLTKSSTDLVNAAGVNHQIIIKNVYQFYVLNRAKTRLLLGDDVKDERFWKVKKIPPIPETMPGAWIDLRIPGDIAANSNWRRFDNCNGILIKLPEIADDGNGFANVGRIPKGIDRQWKWCPGTGVHPPPLFYMVGEDDEGNEVQEVVELKIETYRPDGWGIPANYIIARPIKDIRFSPKETSYVFLGIAYMNANKNEAEFYEIKPDYYKTFRSEFPDDMAMPSQALGDLIGPFDGDDTPTNKVHKYLIKNQGRDLEITSESTTDDFSYIIEFELTEKSPDGNNTTITIGNKWVYGVREIADTWVRDVDITYKHTRAQKLIKAFPDYWKATYNSYTERTYPSDVIGSTLTMSYPRLVAHFSTCGDHENSFNKHGPMFYPYSDCLPPKTVIKDLGIQIDAKIPEEGPSSEKGRIPDLFEPTTLRHNILNLLDPNCVFEYSLGTFVRGGQTEWTGVSRIRGPISREFNPYKWSVYNGMGWMLPTFGNIGRDQIRIFRTAHYREYVYSTLGGSLKVAKGWMPLLPYKPSSSLFDKMYPRVVLEQTTHRIEPNNGLDYFKSDYSNFEIQRNIHRISLELDSNTITKEPDKEKLVLIRMKFDDLFKVIRLIKTDGTGTRYPEPGYFFNYRQASPAAAELRDKILKLCVQGTNGEPYLEIGRQTTLSSDYRNESKILGGVQIHKAKFVIDTSPVIRDRFKREIWASTKEGNYKLSIEDQMYDEAKVTKYAKLNAVDLDDSNNSIQSIYFDRFTGEIMYYNKPGGTKQNYHPDELAKVVDNASPYFSPVGDEYGPSLPGNEGGSYPPVQTTANMLGKNYSFTTEESDPIDDGAVEINAFRSGFFVSKIVPKFMPKKELIYKSKTEKFQSTKPEIKVAPYPDIKWEVREKYENIALTDSFFKIFRESYEDDYKSFVWKPYSIKDLWSIPPVDTNKRQGTPGTIVINVQFKHPIEISYFEIGYRVRGLSSKDWSGSETPTEIPLTQEPSFEIKLFNISTATAYDKYSELTLLGLPERNLKKLKYESNTFYRKIIVSLNDIDRPYVNTKEQIQTELKLTDPLVITGLSITVGNRKDDIEFSLGKILMKALILNEDAKEDIMVIEPRYYPTIGYYNPDNPDDFTRLKSTSYLSGDVANADTSDFLEYNGIAMFWRAPIILPTDDGPVECRTRGKYVRHWAGLFNTYDTQRVFTEGADSSVLISSGGPQENWQRSIIDKIIEDQLNKLVCADGAVGTKGEAVYSPYITILDGLYLGETGNAISIMKPMSIEPSVLSRFIVHEYNADNFLLEIDTYKINQFYGFKACVKSPQRGVRCLGGEGASAYSENQQICDRNDNPILSTHDVFSLAGGDYMLDLYTPAESPRNDYGAAARDVLTSMLPYVALDDRAKEQLKEFDRKSKDPDYNP